MKKRPGPKMSRYVPATSCGLAVLPGEQQPCDSSRRQAAREADEALGVLGQQLLVDPGPVVEALEVRVGDQLQQVPVARLVLGEEREVAVLLLVLPGRRGRTASPGAT